MCLCHVTKQLRGGYLIGWNEPVFPNMLPYGGQRSPEDAGGQQREESADHDDERRRNIGRADSREHASEDRKSQ
jgi:hypothetical protein